MNKNEQFVEKQEIKKKKLVSVSPDKKKSSII
jgi:hypothetical protein